MQLYYQEDARPPFVHVRLVGNLLFNYRKWIYIGGDLQQQLHLINPSLFWN